MVEWVFDNLSIVNIQYFLCFSLYQRVPFANKQALTFCVGKMEIHLLKIVNYSKQLLKKLLKIIGVISVSWYDSRIVFCLFKFKLDIIIVYRPSKVLQLLN